MQQDSSIQRLCDKYGVCVLIPTFNNATTVGKVITDVLRYSQNIIVVNDGSTDNTLEVLKQFQEIKTITYTKNWGKGYALRAGFKMALQEGYNYVITIDSDGQHFAEDIPKFIHKLEGEPNRIIIGTRNMEQSGVPGKSSFGNKFSNFWFWVETGIKLPDTQSGYRLYPIRALSDMTFYSCKYEFEIEVLVRSAWRGIMVATTPVKIYYAEKGKRISHFRPFKDFTRISILNTLLVLITFLYIKPRDFFRSIKKKKIGQLFRELLLDPHETKEIKALSVGFGIFMGVVPIWGFQMMTAIALAFLLKLNRAIVIIFANISIPPMIPFILFGSHEIGKVWMGENAVSVSFDKNFSTELLRDSLLQYVLGAITLSVCAGFLFGMLTYLVMTFLHKPARIKK